jgi:hypothetical protein
MPRLLKPNRSVRRTASFGARQSQQTNQESQMDSVNQSEPEADQAGFFQLQATFPNFFSFLQA